MAIRKVLTFVYEATVAGLATSFVLLLLFRPEIFDRQGGSIKILEAPPPSPSAVANGGGPASYAGAVHAAAPAVVNVFSTKVVTQRMHPLLNEPSLRRFIGGADEIQVGLADGRNTVAHVVGKDPDTDLALLKIELQSLPVIVFGQSDTMQVGDVVLAIGNPFGVGQTVTQGIISATGRQQLGISTFENFIQTAAAINPGNSGGALINSTGQLVGINTAIFSRTGGSQGIGFAIPAHLAKTVMEQLLTQGRVIRGWLGIEAQDISPELAESFELNDTRGALVAGGYPGSAADKAGLRPGDIVLGINGKPVRDAKAAMDITAAFAPGDKAEVELRRNGKSVKLATVIGERPQPE